MDPLLGEHRRAMQEFFARHGSRWPGTLVDAFDILAPWPMARAEANEILEAARGLARIYKRAAELLRCVSDQALLEMGVPGYLLPAARCALPGMADCVIGRLDLARTKCGYKLLEFNADMPGLVVETFSINAQVCRDAEKDDPNEGCELALIQALSDAVRAGLEYVGKAGGEEANVVVTSWGDRSQDRALASYLCRLLAAMPTHYAPIDSLGIDADGLYDPRGNRIDVLYRVIPLRCLRDELFRQRGTSVVSEMGRSVLRFVERRQLAIVNPPFSFLLEGKALQAVIWNLCESGRYFVAEERQLIEQYMLPTYLDPPPDQAAYVVKPFYGGEGDTVKIMASDGRVICEGKCTTHSHQPMVYQEYVELPTEELMTEYGRRKLHVVASCFLIAGTPAGVCLRAGEAITDELAWVLPVCMSGQG